MSGLAALEMSLMEFGAKMTPGAAVPPLRHRS